MITEDYVSFETAKLLKEKGFDEYCTHVYNIETGRNLEADFYTSRYVYNSWLDKNEPRLMVAPTLQMAMKWLREEHHLHCAIGILYMDGKIIYFPNVDSTECSPELEEEFVPEEYHSEKYFHSCEEACEAAIKYCLENLV